MPVDPKVCILCYFLNLNRKPAGNNDVLLLGLQSSSFNFSHSWQAAWGCAGDAWGVPVRVVELRGIKGCGSTNHSHPYLQHASCGLKRIIEAFHDTGQGAQALKDLNLQHTPHRIFFFDQDTLPLPHMDLHNFLEGNGKASLLLFEDFHTGAIYPGTFMAKADDYTVSFFNFVDTFYDSVRTDTGVTRLPHAAFEAALLHWLQDELASPKRSSLEINSSLEWVDSRYKAIRNPETYDRYIATTRYVLGPRRSFDNVVLLRRGHGFCLDIADAVFDLDNHPSHFFCFKTDGVAPQADAAHAACLAKVSICEETISTCMLKPVSQSTATEKIRSYRPKRMGLGMVNDVGKCWPTCGPDVPKDVWQDLERGLHFNAKCANGHCRMGCCCKDIDIVSEQHAAESADAFLLLLVVAVSILIAILCWLVSRRRIRSKQQAQGMARQRSFDLTSPRTISVELVSAK